MNSGPKWSLRNGAQYQRLCARAGCGAAAVATLRFESTQRQAWLVELDVNASRTQGDLCQRHAAALVLPRGWELHDERSAGTWKPVISNDTAESAPKNGAGTRRKRAPRKPKAKAPDALPGFEPEPSTIAAPVAEVAEVVEAVDVTEVAVEVEPVIEVEPEAPVEVHASRPVPAQFGSSDEEDVEEELGEILDARTPLLQRAFRNAKPLTEDDDEG